MSPQTLVGKLSCTKDSKQTWAHDGMKLVTSDGKENPALTQVENTYMSRRRLAGNTAILGNTVGLGMLALFVYIDLGNASEHLETS